jgi:hypothetical protein
MQIKNYFAPALMFAGASQMQVFKARVIAMKAALSACLLSVAVSAGAAWQSSGTLSDYTVSMDNGVVYLTHPSIPAPCGHQRLEIRAAEPYSADYAKRLVALLFSAHAARRSIEVSWNGATAPACVLNSLTVKP